MEGGGGLSTVDREIMEMHHAAGLGHEELRVKVVRSETVLHEHAVPGFDLLKVDVEGAEAAVLGSADLALWRPRVIVVEATLPFDLAAQSSSVGAGCAGGRV
jgi:FkbM family methyltransferase